MIENLNPTIHPIQQKAMVGRIDWSQAPALAAAYIAISVMLPMPKTEVCGVPVHDEVQSTYGCWVLDNGRATRIKAPDFGIIELRPGQTFIMRRPGSDWHPMVLEWLEDAFWPLYGLNDKLMVFSPEDFDMFGIETGDMRRYKRPDVLKMDPLSFRIQVALEPLEP